MGGKLTSGTSLQRRGVVALVGVAALTVGAYTIGTVAEADDDVGVTVIPGPAGSEAFGSDVLVLSNGNYVVADPLHDEGGVQDVGAVYLFNGATNTVISRLTGSFANDRVGDHGLYEVGDSNAVVMSSQWGQNDPNVARSGAATWISGATGVSGEVSTANSLTGHGLGPTMQLTLLADGDYVINSKRNFFDASFTWAPGNSGVAGEVSGSNSLFRTSIISKVQPLANGNYLIDDTDFDVGGLTWADGSVGGHVRSTYVFGGGGGSEVRAFPLSTGAAFAQISPYRGNGAVMRLDVDNGAHGAPGVNTSILGLNGDVSANGGDDVGSAGLYELANGNAVVWSPNATSSSGAQGSLTVIGASEATSGRLQDRVNTWGAVSPSRVFGDPQTSIVPLADGDFLYVSPMWDSPSADDVGLVVRLDGNGAPLSSITDGALTGQSAGDQIGSGGVVALADGGYAVLSPLWDDPSGATDVGAVTWRPAGLQTGDVVSAANSMVGVVAGSQVGGGGAIELANGDVVVASPAWRPVAGSLDRGAVTKVSAAGRIIGPVHLGNSVYGRADGDAVGSGGLVADGSGGFVVSSPDWSGFGAAGNGAVSSFGAAGPFAGPITEANSVHGVSNGDAVGSGSVHSLSNGNILVWTPSFASGAGAVTLIAAGEGGVAISTVNSAIGTGGGLLEPSALLSSDGAVVIPTAENRVVVLRPAETVAPTTTEPSAPAPIDGFVINDPARGLERAVRLGS